MSLRTFIYRMLPAFIGCSVLLSAAAQTSVKGDVKDTSGEPLTGATVLVKGSKTGTVTDINGNFTIQAMQGATLVTSYIGFETSETPVTSGNVHIVLQESSKQLEELVVIGYGSMRKRDITGSITSLTNEDIEKKMSTNVFEALQGQTSGVQIVAGSGQPGEGASVRIRGVSTFSGEGVTPLYIIDGSPVDNIDDINPNDIASLEILKDAASAAIYGSRSANGVIIITTKTGEKSKPRIEVKYNHSWGTLTHKLAQSNREQRLYYDNLRRDYLTANNLGNPDESIQMLQDPYNVFFNTDNDYQDLAFNTGQRDQIDVSIGGAENKLKYYATTAYYNESGIIPNTGYRRLTTRINSDYKASQVLNMGTRFSLSYAKKSGIDEGSFLNSMLQRRPYFSMYYPDGSLVGVFNGQKNPIAQTAYTTDFTDTYRTNFFQFFEFNIIKGLKFRSNINFSAVLDKRKQLIPSIITDEWQNNNSGMAVNYLNWNWLTENYLTYNYKTKTGHNIMAMLGTSAQQWQNETERYRGINSSTDFIYTINAFTSGLDLTNTGTWVFRHALASLFSRVTYDYKGRYLFAVNVRRDGSSRFAKNNKWGNFPSVSGGWRFSDEAFMKASRSFLDDAKLRLSYGITGNEAIGNYDHVYAYSPNTIYDGTGGVGPSRIGVNDLAWEETRQANAGLDLSFFHSRLTVNFDYYNKYTSGLLANFELPKESGYSTIRTNVGEVANQGWELVIAGDIIRKKDWKWKGSFNISRNDNRIQKLSEGRPYMVGNLWWMEEGGRIGDLYGYRSNGVFPCDESNAFTTQWEQLTPVFENGVFQKYQLHGQDYAGTVLQKRLPNGKALRGGDYNWEDVDGSGIIDDNDRTVIGNALPKVTGGFGTELSYKQVSLFLSFYYSFGGEIYNDVEHQRNAFKYTGPTPSPDVIYNIWTKPGDVALYPRPYNDDFDNARYANSFYVEDGSYVKLQNIRLTYDLPKRWLKSVRIKSLGLYGYINNALTWTKYRGYDPEFSNNDPIQIGKDTNRYPKKREIGIGMNVNF